MKALKLLGDRTADDLWPLNNLILVSWALLIFVPYWKLTPKFSLIAPILLSVLYAGTALTLVIWPDPNSPDVDFATLEGVMKMFQDPTNMYAGWVHFVIFDALVARMILIDSLSRGASSKFHILGTVPCFLLVFVMGPTGFLTYMILREVFLPMEQSSDTKLKIL